ncbi:hypothetical protein [Thermofilum sp.]|uniref:hypothetical protein n=1 Tax=Thermofilum sp. TaxID=1961369 RepID=UPI003182A53B
MTELEEIIVDGFKTSQEKQRRYIIRYLANAKNIKITSRPHTHLVVLNGKLQEVTDDLCIVEAQKRTKNVIMKWPKTYVVVVTLEEMGYVKAFENKYIIHTIMYYIPKQKNK